MLYGTISREGLLSGQDYSQRQGGAVGHGSQTTDTIEPCLLGTIGRVAAIGARCGAGFGGVRPGRPGCRRRVAVLGSRSRAAFGTGRPNFCPT